MVAILSEIYMNGGLSKSCEGHDSCKFPTKQPDPTFLISRLYFPLPPRLPGKQVHLPKIFKSKLARKTRTVGEILPPSHPRASSLTPRFVEYSTISGVNFPKISPTTRSRGSFCPTHLSPRCEY